MPKIKELNFLNAFMKNAEMRGYKPRLSEMREAGEVQEQIEKARKRIANARARMKGGSRRRSTHRRGGRTNRTRRQRK